MDRIFLSSPHVNTRERELILEAFDSNWIAPLGPHVDAFERELASCTARKHAAALSSGTGAMHIALRLLGVGPGDTVLVPSFTFVATVSPVVQLGATPIFIDSEPRTWNIDAELVDEELTGLTKQGRPPEGSHLSRPLRPVRRLRSTRASFEPPQRTFDRGCSRSTWSKLRQ